MKNFNLIIPIILALFLSFEGNSQSKKVDGIVVSETHAVKLGKTGKIVDLVAKPSTSREKKAQWKKDKLLPDNFMGRRGQSSAIIKELEHLGPDPVRQWEVIRNRSLANEPLVNVEGLTSGFSPNDPTGSVGKDHYVMAVNATDVGVYSKTGELLSQFSMNTLWSDLGRNSAGDPIILYDQEFDRWLLTEFPPQGSLLVAISDDSDPLGSYTAYEFSTPNFPDYPKYGIWNNALVVTTNEEGAGSVVQYLINREELMMGADNPRIQRITFPRNANSEQGFIVSTPVDWHGDTQPTGNPITLLLNDSSWGIVPNDAVEVYEFDINWDNPDSTELIQTTIETAPFDAFPCVENGVGFECVPQQGTTGLDGVPEVIMNVPIMRSFDTHESIVYCFITDATDGDNLAGMRWVELRKEMEGEWTLYQEGTFAPEDGLHRFMGSVGIDKFGNIGLAYNVSGEEAYAGIRYTGRRVADPLGMMTQGETIVVEGENEVNSSPGRFSDYSHLSIDPEDNLTFWFLAEYGGDQGSNVRIAAFKFTKDTTDLVSRTLVSPVTNANLSSEEIVTFDIVNDGLVSVANYDVGLMVDGNILETTTIEDTLRVDETYQHTFDMAIDLSALGDYDIKCFTSLNTDDNPNNDTLSTIVSNYASIDAAVSAQSVPPLCGSEGTISLILANQGFDTLTTANIEVELNGTIDTIIEYNGNILFQEQDEISVDLENLTEGENTVIVSILNPNGGVDQDIDDNQVTVTFNVFSAAGLVTFNLQTDEYPQETEWELLDNSGAVIVSGGDYNVEFQLESEDLCLDPDACYNFFIQDDYGDGICCGFGEGFYTIENQDGVVVLDGNGDFGASDFVPFCLDEAACNIMVDIDIQDPNAGSQDGVIMINISGGNGPVMYSIDGGETFSSVSIFEDLPAGDYDIVVQYNQAACTYEASTSLTVLSSTEDILNSVPKMTILPNPNDGVFQVVLDNFEGENYIEKVQVLDINGKLIQERKIAKYDESYIAMISLYSYPNGKYFVRFTNPEIDLVATVIKQ